MPSFCINIKFRLFIALFQNKKKHQPKTCYLVFKIEPLYAKMNSINKYKASNSIFAIFSIKK